ncbi:hypothetical protein H0H92_004605 [Tricholoma furcatifolium]|nr:hypothetical protein H0H92_004605 [Tricholoma furcatifolium]
MESPYDCTYDYDSYTKPKPVVFPPPPPTINALSPVQRARLVRSSKKIARVLGTTPHFVDYEDSSIGTETTLIPSLQTISRASSIHSTDSLSSCSTTFSSTSQSSTLSSTTSISSSSSSASASRKPLPVISSQSTWPTHKRKSSLRLSMESSLESIPASPRTPTFSSILSLSADVESPLNGHALSLDENTFFAGCLDDNKQNSCAFLESPEASPTAPSFIIPTPTSTRRRKMDRLRRLLGEDVPVRLVFPQSRPISEGSDSDSEPSFTPGGQTSSEDELSTPNTSPCSPTSPLHDIDFNCPKPKSKVDVKMEGKPLPRVPRTPLRKKKITNARDSLALPSSASPSKSAGPSFVIPKHTRPAPPPPEMPSPPSSPNKKVKTGSKMTKTKSLKVLGLLSPSKTSTPTLPSEPVLQSPPPRTSSYEHPPIVHRGSHSGPRGLRAIEGLDVILELEEKAESEWYASDDEVEIDEKEYEFVREEQVPGSIYGWGNGAAYMCGGSVEKEIGRGLARSYGFVGYVRA